MTTTPTPKTPLRRTQEERRSATIRRLIDAATDTLVEVGYSEASVQSICTRAGVSQGALFRHFATREALMVAVGQDVGAKILASYKRAFEMQKGAEHPLLLAVKLMRKHSRSKLNNAWYELFVAARTHEPLRKALEPTIKNYYDEIVATARQTAPEVSARLGDNFRTVVMTLVAVFDGENMQRFVLGSLPEEKSRTQLLGLLASLAR